MVLHFCCTFLASTRHTFMMKSKAPERSFQWSELGRRSADVGHALDEFGEVTVTRSGEVLRLAPAATPTMVEFTQSLWPCSPSWSSWNSLPSSRCSTAAWPWTKALPADDQIALAHEVGELAEICAELGSWSPLAVSLAAWRGTARAWFEGFAPLAPIEIAGPLDAPALRPS